VKSPGCICHICPVVFIHGPRVAALVLGSWVPHGHPTDRKPFWSQWRPLLAHRIFSRSDICPSSSLYLATLGCCSPKHRTVPLGHPVMAKCFTHIANVTRLKSSEKRRSDWLVWPMTMENGLSKQNTQGNTLCSMRYDVQLAAHVLLDTSLASLVNAG